MISQYFIEFVFYSFLGWVWESIYCTAKSRKWEDRGFLFGPVCPIYGVCVVAAHVVFDLIPNIATEPIPMWGIFLICMVGSAVMEFTTSFYLEKRFHAKWWDYSEMPLNIQGRICLPVSICFGLAGVVIVQYVLPATNDVQVVMPILVTEILALVFAAVLGADLALTEASLSSLLKEVETYKEEMNARAEERVENISQHIEDSVNKYKEYTATRTELLQEYSNGFLQQMPSSHKHVLKKIKRFKFPLERRDFNGMTALEFLKDLQNKRG